MQAHHCTACGEAGHNAVTCPLRHHEIARLAVIRAEMRARGVTREQWDAAPPPPLQREDCEAGPRPCPALRCRHHNGPHASRTCDLDVADDGPQTLITIGELLRVSRERVRQIENSGKRRLRSLVTLDHRAPVEKSFP